MFPFNVKANNLLPWLHKLDFPMTYRNASVLCQSECACLHKTVNMVVFLVKSNENTYRKGKALMQRELTELSNSAITMYMYI